MKLTPQTKVSIVLLAAVASGGAAALARTYLFPHVNGGGVTEKGLWGAVVILFIGLVFMAYKYKKS